MEARITILTDNTGLPGFKSEHGFSVLLETGEHSLLFDTGESSIFLDNARRAGRDITSVDTVMISHNHYDHASGVSGLFGLLHQPRLITGSGFFAEKYSIEDAQSIFKGGSVRRDRFEQERWSIITVMPEDSPFSVYSEGGGVYAVTGFSRNYPWETIDHRFMVKSASGSLKSDQFAEEIVLVIPAAEGLVVIVGCSHPGIMNMLERIRQLFDQPIHAVIGGTHLHDAADGRIERTADYLAELGLQQAALSHCTGEHAREVFAERGLPVGEAGAGRVITFHTAD